MNRADRLLKILVLLQSREVATIDLLKQHFRISTRTAYQDLEALKSLKITVTFKATKGCFILIASCPSTSNGKEIVSRPMMILPPAIKNEIPPVLWNEEQSGS